MQAVNLDAEAFIESLKTLPMHYTCELDSDGSYLGNVKELQALESAETPEALKVALVKLLKENAIDFVNMFSGWKKGREWQIPYLLKVLTSTEQELLSCLHGGI